MRNYAFINSDGIVVQIIVGDLMEQQQARFLGEYRVIFGATQIVAVDEGAPVWIGGSYIDGIFSPPIQPEIEQPMTNQLEGTPDGIPVIE